MNTHCSELCCMLRCTTGEEGLFRLRSMDLLTADIKQPPPRPRCERWQKNTDRFQHESARTNRLCCTISWKVVWKGPRASTQKWRKTAYSPLGRPAKSRTSMSFVLLVRSSFSSEKNSFWKLWVVGKTVSLQHGEVHRRIRITVRSEGKGENLLKGLPESTRSLKHSSNTTSDHVNTTCAEPRKQNTHTPQTPRVSGSVAPVTAEPSNNVNHSDLQLPVEPREEHALAVARRARSGLWKVQRCLETGSTEGWPRGRGGLFWDWNRAFKINLGPQHHSRWKHFEYVDLCLRSEMDHHGVSALINATLTL